MKKASVITLGCKVNSFDTALLWEGLEERGYRVSDKIEPADISIINTCSVTNNATSQSRKTIRKIRKINPDSLVVVTGCYAQLNPDEISEMDGVDYIVGNMEKPELLDLIAKNEGSHGERVFVGDISEAESIDGSILRGFQRKSRAFLRVQDGCDAFCTYCIIPYARGCSRTLPIEDVENQVFELAENGFKEIVLTGIHLGAYGLDLTPKSDLLTLLKRLDNLDVECRFRISSIEPTEIDDEILEFLISSKKICRHLHIPLQSGDKEILQKMGRKYYPSYYRKKVEKIVSKWNGVAIGIDIIAGFPGENNMAFKNSYDLIKDMPAAYLHVFPYSKRNGTDAAGMAGHVDRGEVKERCAILRALGKEKSVAFSRNFLGKRLNVVRIEEENDHLKTLSDNYIEIMIDKNCNFVEERFNLEIFKIDGLRCYGKIV